MIGMPTPDGLTLVGSNAADLKDASRALGGEMRDLGRRRALAVLATAVTV
jgi:hypothetical protein